MSMSTAEIRDSIDSLLPDRFEMGYTKATTLIDNGDIPIILKVISHHVAIDSCRSELDQLAEGLELFGFLTTARNHPWKMARLLEVDTSKTITADILMDLFHISYSNAGSNARKKEESVIVAFNNILMDIEGEYMYIVPLMLEAPLPQIVVPCWPNMAWPPVTQRSSPVVPMTPNMAWLISHSIKALW